MEHLNKFHIGDTFTSHDEKVTIKPKAEAEPFRLHPSLLSKSDGKAVKGKAKVEVKVKAPVKGGKRAYKSSASKQKIKGLRHSITSMKKNLAHQTRVLEATERAIAKLDDDELHGELDDLKSARDEQRVAIKELKARLRTRQEELGDELSVADAISKLIQSEM